MPIVIVRTVLWPTSIRLLIARLAFERGGEVAPQIGELAAQPREDAAARGDRVTARIGRNRAETAIAADHGGDALREFEFHAGIAEERAVVVCVGVDESRRETCAVAVDLAGCRRRATHRGDAARIDLHIGVERGTTAAVEHPHVAYREIDHRFASIVALQNPIMSARNASASSPWLPIFAPRRP